MFLNLNARFSVTPLLIPEQNCGTQFLKTLNPAIQFRQVPRVDANYVIFIIIITCCFFFVFFFVFLIGSKVHFYTDNVFYVELLVLSNAT